MRAAIGTRVFGCDDCLAVCPWNKFAEASREIRFHARDGTDSPPIAELLTLDDADLSDDTMPDIDDFATSKPADHLDDEEDKD